MKSRESLIQLRRFEVDEKRQKVTDIEMMITDFNRMAEDLQRQIEMEQQRAGVSDVNHYAYPTFAKAAVQRRENLLASVADLEARLEEARAELAAAFEELKKVEKIEERDTSRQLAKQEKAEQAELDEIARNTHMRVANRTY